MSFSLTKHNNVEMIILWHMFAHGIGKCFNAKPLQTESIQFYCLLIELQVTKFLDKAMQAVKSPYFPGDWQPLTLNFKFVQSRLAT